LSFVVCWFNPFPYSVEISFLIRSPIIINQSNERVSHKGLFALFGLVPRAGRSGWSWRGRGGRLGKRWTGSAALRVPLGVGGGGRASEPRVRVAGGGYVLCSTAAKIEDL